MFNMTVPWWELLLRALLIYLFVLLILRLGGKRQIGQLSPFDLVLLLLLSNAVQNAMNGGDNSLIGGMILASCLIAVHYGISLLAFRNKKVEALLEGRPQMLIHNGRLFEDVMVQSKLSHHELNMALREAGCASVDDVRYAVLETSGSISVIAKRGA